MEIRAFVVSPIGSNCYVLSDSLSPGAQAVVIDPGDTGLDAVFEYIDSNLLKVTAVWSTHGHFDHVMGVDLVRARYGVPALLHEADVPLWDSLQEVTRQWLRRDVTALNPPDRFWQDGDVVTVGSLKFTIMHTRDTPLGVSAWSETRSRLQGIRCSRIASAELTFHCPVPRTWKLR